MMFNSFNLGFRISYRFGNRVGTCIVFIITRRPIFFPAFLGRFNFSYGTSTTASVYISRSGIVPGCCFLLLSQPRHCDASRRFKCKIHIKYECRNKT